MKICFLIPIFNDWHSFGILVQKIDEVLTKLDYRADIIAVNDGSDEEIDQALWSTMAYKQINTIDVIDLACNLGHQQAVAIGLGYIVDLDTDMIVIMDGDGEDCPSDLPELFDAFSTSNTHVVLAQRNKRSEGLLFCFFYWIYKLVFHSLTGFSLTFGNYCILSPQAAKRLTYMPNLWNSLPATCLRSKLPYRLVPTKRGRRYAGSPKMNFVNLILHGMRAITVFSDTVIVRLTLIILAAGALAALIVPLIRFYTDWVPLGWASNMLGFAGVSVLLILFGLLTTSLLTLQGRSSAPFIPYIHGKDFILRTRRIWG